MIKPIITRRYILRSNSYNLVTRRNSLQNIRNHGRCDKIHIYDNLPMKSNHTTALMINNHLIRNRTIHTTPSIRNKENNEISINTPKSEVIENEDVLTKHSKRIKEILSKNNKLSGYEYYNEVKDIIKEIQDSIDSNIIDTSNDQQIVLASQIFNHSLHIISSVELHHSNGNSNEIINEGRFDTCISILTSLHNLNLDISQEAFKYTIKAGCIDGKYTDASELFTSQLDDINCGSMVPMINDYDGDEKGDCPIEIGLYAIAKSYDNEQEASEQVFDAALTMAITNPTDYNKYMIAAIHALGHANYYKPCVEFLHTAEGQKVGQALLAAVMKICIQCNEYSQAIELYEDLLHSDDNIIHSDWQTSGTYYNIQPDIHDIALIAYQHLLSIGDFDEYDALEIKNKCCSIFNNAISSQYKISPDALNSMLLLCHKSKDWELSIVILQQLLYHKLFSIDDYDGMIPNLTNGMISCILNTCIECHQDSMALLSLYFIQLHYFDDIALGGKSTDGFVDNMSQWSILQASDEILSCALKSLYNMKQYDKVVTLFDNVTTQSDGGNIDETFCKSKDMYNQAQKASNSHSSSSDNATNTTSIDIAWNELFIYLNELLSRRNVTNQKETLSKIINLCTELNLNSNVWYYITKWALATTLYAPKNIDDIVIPSFLQQSTNNFGTNNNDDVIMDYLSSNDSLLSSMMESDRKNDSAEKAIHSYFSKMEQIDSIESSNEEIWKQSAFQCLISMIESNKVDKAYDFFLHMKQNEYTTQSIVSMARCLEEQERWDDIANVWRIAVDSFCLNEEIGLIALKAVSRSNVYSKNKETDLENGDHNHELTVKVSLFRMITKKMSEITNKEPMEWAKSHYWKLKKDLLQKDLHRLLNWKYGEIKANEMQIAFVDFMNYATSQDEDVQRQPMDKDVVISIIKKAGYKQRHVRCRGNPIPDKKEEEEKIIQEEQRKEGIDIILKVLQHLQKNKKTTLLYDPNFTVNVAQALRALKADALVIEYVRNLVLLEQQKNIELRPMTYLQAVFAATSLNDQHAKDEILSCMRNAGLTFDIDKEMLRMKYLPTQSDDGGSW